MSRRRQDPIVRLLLKKGGKGGAVIAVLIALVSAFSAYQGTSAPGAEAYSHEGLATSGSASILFPANFPEDFRASKRMLMQIHAEHPYEIYCGCSFGAASGDRDLSDSCPVSVDVYENRADAIEWEHVVPASDFGRQRACWRNAPSNSREYCGEHDPVFRGMEADPHNLWPAVGALNAIRSNHRFGMVPRASTNQFGPCGFKIEGRVVEPPDSAKGLIARTYFYMEDRYGHRISDSQRAIFSAWDRQFPPSAWEIKRAGIIGQKTGVENRFAMGLK